METSHYYTFWIDFGFAIKYANVWAKTETDAKAIIQSRYVTRIKRYDLSLFL